MASGDSKVRVAAAGDLHCREDGSPGLRDFVRQVNADADLLVLCGDLTDRGLVAEARALAEGLSALRIPCAAVLGNHDYDGDLAKEVSRILRDVGVVVLDGDHVMFGEVGIAGVKGYSGGFDQATLQAFGEPLTKAFVQEAVNEALKLESALGQLDAPKRLVITHYAPIATTTEGERPEIRAYLGTSRLAAPIDTYGADAAFHGHAHYGTHRGRTGAGVNVYNVAMPLLRRTQARQFVIVEI